MVDGAMKTYNGIYRHRPAADLVLETEDTNRFPVGSHWTVFKLVEVCRKATIANTVVCERVVELLAGVNYRVRSGTTEAGEITVKGLNGRGQQGNKGLLDLVLYQYQFRLHLLNDTLAALTIPDNAKATLRKALQGYKSFEEECLGEKGLAWIGVLPKAAQLFQKLVQSACFLTDHDPALKRGLRSQQSIPELLTEPPFADLLKTILDSIAATVSVANPGSTATASIASDAEEDDIEPKDSQVNQIAMNLNLATNQPAERSVKTAFTNLEKTKKAKVKEFAMEAMRLVEIGCELLVDKPTSQEMSHDIRMTERAQLKGSPIDGYCLWVYCPRVAGESKTQPQTRVPPLRTLGTQPGGNHVRRMLTAAMMVRAPPSENYELDDGDLFLVSDAGRRANSQTMMHSG